MHPARIASLKSKIRLELSFTPQNDNEVSLLLPDKVADCFVDYLKRIDVQSLPLHSGPIEVIQGLVEMYFSLTMGEAEKLLSDFVQQLQDTDLGKIYEAHPQIFIGEHEVMRS